MMMARFVRELALAEGVVSVPLNHQLHCHTCRPGESTPKVKIRPQCLLSTSIAFSPCVDFLMLAIFLSIDVVFRF